MQGLLAGLEATPLAAVLRGSVWLYPLVNAAHIAGIALLFGAITALDLRLIGLWPRQSAAVLSRVLTPVAVAGFALAASMGALLFICKASEYAAASLFQAKMAVVAFGVVNAALAWRWMRHSGAGQAIPRRVRAAAAASLATWLSAILLGRLVGYF
ncbi:MAG: hypothetical protein RIM84_12425 [Alphaproteobacteria bacterium]